MADAYGDGLGALSEERDELEDLREEVQGLRNQLAELRNAPRPPVVVEVQGGLVEEIHNSEWFAIDWDIFESGPTDEEINDFEEHVREVVPFIHDEQVRTNILNTLAHELEQARRVQ